MGSTTEIGNAFLSIDIKLQPYVVGVDKLERGSKTMKDASGSVTKGEPQHSKETDIYFFPNHTNVSAVLAYISVYDQNLHAWYIPYMPCSDVD